MQIPAIIINIIKLLNIASINWEVKSLWNEAYESIFSYGSSGICVDIEHVKWVSMRYINETLAIETT